MAFGQPEAANVLQFPAGVIRSGSFYVLRPEGTNSKGLKQFVLSAPFPSLAGAEREAKEAIEKFDAKGAYIVTGVTEFYPTIRAVERPSS